MNQNLISQAVLDELKGMYLKYAAKPLATEHPIFTQDKELYRRKLTWTKSLLVDIEDFLRECDDDVDNKFNFAIEDPSQMQNRV